MQTLIPLAEGQLKLTESKFYRISGDSTQHRGVIPDVEFPSQYDKSEIGESTLDNALNWDQINPVRHRKYHDFPALVPYLTDIYESRVVDNPDFIYLQDSLVLAEEVRGMTTLPLNEKSRIALRDTQKEKSLAIENKRRKAKGLEPLEDFETDTEEELTTAGVDVSASAEDGEEEEADVLLVEAGNVLVDVVKAESEMLASNQRLLDKASRTP